MKFVIMTIWLFLAVAMSGCVTHYDGINGLNGAKGSDGSDGYSVVFKTLNVASSCSNGGQTIMVASDTNRNGLLDALDANIKSSEVCNGLNGSNGVNGSDGHDGVDGANGSDGHDGTNGLDGSNGVDGTNGHDGLDAVTSPYTPVDLVSFCGDIGLTWGEVGLRLSGGMIIASFSDNAGGSNTRWVVVKPGSYRTTDGYNCNFTVNADGTITR